MEKDQTTESLTNADAPVDASKRQVLAKLGKYAAYTAPVMLITLGAKSAKAQQIGSGEDPSDKRLKRDIQHLATLADGTKLYAFRYLWSEDVFVGVMAQDLLADPAKRHAVILGQSGYFQVDYAKLGLRMAKLEEWDRLGLSSVQQRRDQTDTLPLAMTGSAH